MRQETPFQLGFRMPAEWEPHEATWISWPHNLDSWPGAFEPVPGTFVEIVKQIVPTELVRINVAGEEMEAEVRSLLTSGGVPLERVRFHHNPTNDCWVRDHGPIYVVRDEPGQGDPAQRERAIVHWGYNAWGGKYPPFDRDCTIPQRISEEFHERRFEPGMILEGGSIEVNGQGVLLTSEACLLNPNRNPTLSRDEIERRLHDYLGVTQVLWLGDGIVGDDTDGHIDDMTRFVGPRTILTAVEPDPADPNFDPLQDNLLRLRLMKDARGRPFEIVTLPMPGPVLHEEHRVPASYANFLIINGAVLVPTYRDQRDAEALAVIQSVFPNRRVVGIDCTDLVWGLGAIHCATQQQPVGRPLSAG